MSVPVDELYQLLQLLKQVSGPEAVERCIRAKADRKFLEAMRIQPDLEVRP